MTAIEFWASKDSDYLRALYEKSRLKVEFEERKLRYCTCNQPRGYSHKWHCDLSELGWDER